MNLVFLFSLFILACYAQNRTYNCGAQSLNWTCAGETCPVVIASGGYLAQTYNVSYADISVGFDSRHPTIDQLNVVLLDLNNYARLLANQAYTTIYSGYNWRGWCSDLQASGDSQGRGWVVLYWCRNTQYDCTVWYDTTLSNVVEECATGCRTGTVGNGICDTACNTPACASDGGDCQTQTSASSSSGTTAGGVLCATGCYTSMLGDGVCQAACDYPSCSYDLSDCLAINNPCANNPCQHGTQCIQEDNNEYRCECGTAYCGVNCTGVMGNNTNPSATIESCSPAYESCSEQYSHFTFCCDGVTNKCIENIGATSAAGRLSLLAL